MAGGSAGQQRVVPSSTAGNGGNRSSSRSRVMGTVLTLLLAAAWTGAVAASAAALGSTRGRSGGARQGGVAAFLRPAVPGAQTPRRSQWVGIAPQRALEARRWAMGRGGQQQEAEGGQQPELRRPRRRRGEAVALLDPPQRYGSQDWIENLKSLLVSRIAKRISGHLIFNTAWAAMVTVLFELHPDQVGVHISPIPHQLMSSALGLLLVFRTNAAYDRFWEARKVWGSVTNVCRNLARTAAIALDRKYHSRFAMLVIAYSVSLKAHLQRTVVSTELEALLPNWECDQIRIEPCPPALICMKMSHLIDEAVSQNAQRSAEFYNLYMEQLVGELVNCLGMAERILLTPVPASYSRHTSRFLSLYTLSLPFVLVQQLELLTVPAIAAICWGLFSIEEIGHLIEEPFSPTTNQLPLDKLTRTITRDVRRLLRVPDDEGVMAAAPWVDEDLLSAEDREFAENAPRQPSSQAPVGRGSSSSSSSSGGGSGVGFGGGEGGGAALAAVEVGRNSTVTAASAAARLRSTETMNI